MTRFMFPPDVAHPYHVRPGENRQGDRSDMAGRGAERRATRERINLTLLANQPRFFAGQPQLAMAEVDVHI
jgi:hypothetical protein